MSGGASGQGPGSLIPVYWAFLSYCSSDRTFAQWLHRALETYSVPRRLVGRATPVGPAPRRFRPIFRDRAELAADPNLSARIDRALAQSAYLIVICSPQAAMSHWVDEEIVRFRAMHGDARIFTVIVGSPVGRHHDCFPPALRYRADSGSGAAVRPEPIAADLRPGGDGRTMARLKLVAGMLGVGLDELVRRDHKRRQRQLVAVTSASVAAMTILAILAITALLARNEAQRQRAHAEGLIEFMLTDLRKRLEPSGRLSLMDGVGREALKYYKAQNTAKLDPQSLARRARALRLMGEIMIQRGDLSEALNSFGQASAATGELLARSPDDGQSIFNHAQNVFWVGEIARQRGDRVKAEQSFQQYRHLAERLTAIDPQNDEWRAEVAYAQSALGVLVLEEGRGAEAIVAFEGALAVTEDLARHHSSDLSRQVELGQRHAWLADALQKQGRLAAARAQRETELSIYQSVLTQDPTIRQAKFSTIVALQILGRLVMIEGDATGALRYFTNAATQAESLLANERDNMDLSSVVAAAIVDLGEALLANGQVDAARGAHRRARELITMALAHDDTVTLWRNYRDRTILLEAAIDAKSGRYSEALQLDQNLLHSLQGKTVTNSNTDAFWLLERCRLQTGNDLSALGREMEARDTWNAIAQSLANPIETYEPRLLIVLEEADLRLERLSAARAIVKRVDDLSRQTGSQ